MAQTLSNLATPLQVSSLKNRHHFSKVILPNYPYSVSGITKRCNVKGMMGRDGAERGSLDHLQRVSDKQQPARRTTSQPTPVVLWDRFPSARTVQQMMETMDRLIDDPLSFNSATWQSPTSGYSRGRTPWEIKEGEGEYKMRFDMPGMTKQDVKLYVEEKMLVVKAEKRDDEKETEGERESDWPAKSYGKYSSRIALPENVDFEKIKAEVKDGVLYITIPKVSGGSKVLDINVE